MDGTYSSRHDFFYSFFFLLVFPAWLCHGWVFERIILYMVIVMLPGDESKMLHMKYLVRSLLFCPFSSLLRAKF